jgi:hypothetical protein
LPQLVLHPFVFISHQKKKQSFEKALIKGQSTASSVENFEFSTMKLMRVAKGDIAFIKSLL